VASARPANQVCPICGYDDGVEIVLADDDRVITCEGRSHPPFEWRPKEQYHKPLSPRSGIGEELGVYDGFAQFGVVECRLWVRAPTTYPILVERYGHTVYGPSRYTPLALLGGALGHLWREQLVEGVWVSATGTVGAYTRMGTPHETPHTSWQDFALATLGVNPRH
jgi:hypothetical protein